MKRITADIFAVGRWNNRDFTVQDLDGIVASFDALSLSGRVPLKVGHEGPDARNDPSSQFAYGWVRKVWRVDSVLKADLEVGDEAAAAIRDGKLRFVSVELLSNVQADTRRIPWVLDAVALLGTEQPAVGTLAPLAAAAQRAALKFESRTTFSRGDTRQMDELKKLKNEYALEILDNAIREQRILPRDKHAFTKRYADNATPEDARQWIQDSPRPDPVKKFGRVDGASNSPMSGRVGGEDAGEKIVAAALELMETRASEGRPIDFDRAVVLTMKRDGSLAQQYKSEVLGER